MKKALYLTFETGSGGQYLYDSQTSAVMNRNDLMMKAIDLYEKWPIEKVREELYKEYALDEVDGMLLFIVRWEKQYGGFYCETAATARMTNEMEIFSESDIEKHITSGGLFQLVLHLTEDCNLRCKYCTFSDAYDYTRNRTSTMMPVETGIKAMDRFFDLVKPYARKLLGRSVAVTFYGGEPLLNFTTLKQLVSYGLANSPLPVSFHISTNGVVMEGEVMDYLVANNFSIAVSLDGNKDNHNRNRIFANSEGSFNRVIANIERFCKKYPTYKKIFFLCTFDVGTDVEANVEFFERNNNLPFVGFVNMVADINTKYYEQFSQEDWVQHQEQDARLLKKYMTLKKKGERIPDYLRVYWEQRMVNVIIRNRVLDTRSKMLPYTASCVPGMKMSVRVDGTLDMCERVNQTLSIGNVEKGIDLTAIEKIIRLYNSNVAKECSDCVIKKGCLICFANCNANQSFDVSSDSCERMLELFRLNLRIMYSILEEQPCAYDEYDINQLKNNLIYS